MDSTSHNPNGICVRLLMTIVCKAGGLILLALGSRLSRERFHPVSRGREAHRFNSRESFLSFFFPEGDRSMRKLNTEELKLVYGGGSKEGGGTGGSGHSKTKTKTKSNHSKSHASGSGSKC